MEENGRTHMPDKQRRLGTRPVIPMRLDGRVGLLSHLKELNQSISRLRFFIGLFQAMRITVIMKGIERTPDIDNAYMPITANVPRIIKVQKFLKTSPATHAMNDSAHVLMNCPFFYQ
jgi:hypothetical protein